MENCRSSRNNALSLTLSSGSQTMNCKIPREASPWELEQHGKVRFSPYKIHAVADNNMHWRKEAFDARCIIVRHWRNCRSTSIIDVAKRGCQVSLISMIAELKNVCSLYLIIVRPFQLCVGLEGLRTKTKAKETHRTFFSLIFSTLWSSIWHKIHFFYWKKDRITRLPQLVVDFFSSNPSFM